MWSSLKNTLYKPTLAIIGIRSHYHQIFSWLFVLDRLTLISGDAEGIVFTESEEYLPWYVHCLWICLVTEVHLYQSNTVNKRDKSWGIFNHIVYTPFSNSGIGCLQHLGSTYKTQLYFLHLNLAPLQSVLNNTYFSDDHDCTSQPSIPEFTLFATSDPCRKLNMRAIRLFVIHSKTHYVSIGVFFSKNYSNYYIV